LEKWIARIPNAYRENVLGEGHGANLSMETDPNCVARVKDYRSLIPMAEESRKAMFFLKPADGALGAHTYAVAEAYRDFLNAAREIGRRIGVEVP
jgi:hypothetical protein